MATISTSDKERIKIKAEAHFRGIEDGVTINNDMEVDSFTEAMHYHCRELRAVLDSLLSEDMVQNAERPTV